MKDKQVENAENINLIFLGRKKGWKEPEKVWVEGRKNGSPHNGAPCKDVTNVARQNLP